MTKSNKTQCCAFGTLTVWSLVLIGATLTLPPTALVVGSALLWPIPFWGLVIGVYLAGKRLSNLPLTEESRLRRRILIARKEQQLVKLRIVAEEEERNLAKMTNQYLDSEV